MKTIITAALGGYCACSWGFSFLSFDARSIAMGGAGVATARPHNASLFNPALLISHDPRRRTGAHGHVYVGARLLDRDNFIEAAEDFDDRYGDVDLEEYLEDAGNVRAMDFTSGDDLREASGKVRALQNDVNRLSNKPLHASASYGVAFSFRFNRWALGGYQREFLVLGSVAKVAEADNAAIDYYVDTVDTLAHLVDEINAVEREIRGREYLTLEDIVAYARRLAPAVRALDNYVDFDGLQADALEGRLRGNGLEDYLRQPVPDTFQSTIETRGAEVTEQGLSLAGIFPNASLAGNLHLGITLKQLDFTSISFTQRVNDFSLEAYRDEQHRRDYRRRANADIGILYDSTRRWQMGFVVRNLISDTFTTVNGDRLPVRPSARMGFGYMGPTVRLSLDVDLTRNEPLGFDPDRQYLSMGAEWFVWRNTAIRTGLRTNMVNGESLPSLGFGIGGHHGHFDLAVARSLNADEWAASLQAGLAF